MCFWISLVFGILVIGYGLFTYIEYSDKKRRRREAENIRRQIEADSRPPIYSIALNMPTLAVKLGNYAMETSFSGNFHGNSLPSYLEVTKNCGSKNQSEVAEESLPNYENENRSSRG